MTGRRQRPQLEIVYFTLVAVALYFFSDWVLTRIEMIWGKRLEHRSFIFFAILLALALISFEVISWLASS